MMTSETIRSQLNQFQSIIFEPNDVVEVRCLRKNPKAYKSFWVLAKDLPDMYGELHALNQQRFNIYAGPNPRKDFKLSGDKNVLLARCLFVDFDHIEPGDGCGIREFVEMDIFFSGLPQPTLFVFSGHGIHAYWRLDEPIGNMTQWTSIQSRLIKKLNSDPVIKNPERIMRLPGFKNMKCEPYPDVFICWSEAQCQSH